ncbi:cytochrome P460 family protein [Nitratireductor sp. GCM10026969]|uniref:cytochrome P460 family protein n=1 Tax=Nitratireductor sp. GCM10026969 TaxID=3252645 RepID=UPI00360E2F12
MCARTFAKVGFALALIAPGTAVPQDGQPPFGDDTDTTYAETLWSALTEASLAGEEAIQAKPYEGTEPHGAVLQTLWTDIEVEGQEGMVVVKRNYGPAGISIEEVANNPGDSLASVTVMFRREEGYAPESGNWFWAKYLPDGSLDQTPEGVPLAGQATGCISCHSEAEGGDFLYTMDSQS